ncbi:MAG: hypothetical protein GF320_02380 [Armatimonadia bacterium]|nr:hypothetical protein [Armatimonadia bacterium]
MPRECDCSGTGCGPSPLELSRREFLKSLGVGAVALWGGSLFAGKAVGLPTAPGATRLLPEYDRYAMTPPRTYTGEHLGAVAMPIGGIGTGTIWLDGQGRLRVWQIFNNYTENRVPDSFFALRVERQGEDPVVRILQTEPEYGFEACPSLVYEGGYPMARLFFDTGTPVSVRMDAFNPMIPTDTDNSSIPCAIFRFNLKNEGNETAQVSLLGALQNAVGWDGAAHIDGVSCTEYALNENRLERTDDGYSVVMDTATEPPPPGFLRARDPETRKASDKALLYMERLDTVEAMAESGMGSIHQLEALAGLSDRNAVALCASASAGFFEDLPRAQQLIHGWEALDVFEDFEKPNYEGWTVEGSGFGDAPSGGTEGSQQQVTGFVGDGLVNTFLPNDGPKGRLISKPFTIERKYIGFLIGGGNHPNETCINLVVDGEVVRTETGRNSEQLLPATWDVESLRGKEARFEIVDQRSDGWGHINIDHIVMSDAPPDRLLRLLVPMGRLAPLLALEYGPVVTMEVGDFEVSGDVDTAGLPDWRPGDVVRLQDLKGDGLQVLAKTAGGHPLIVSTKLGDARVVISLSEEPMPWEWSRAFLVAAAGFDSQVSFESTRTGWGSMTLNVHADSAFGTANWTEHEDLVRAFETTGRVPRVRVSGRSEPGSTYNAAVGAPLTLRPGDEATVTFSLTWHFPNAERLGHEGNYYAEIFPDAATVAEYLQSEMESLTTATELYHKTIYQSNIPEEFIDAITSQSVIPRGPTCWRDASGYFGGFEGCYGCCPLNCTHVWNYAQTHARLWPEIGRNLRVSDLITYIHDSGETSHRQHSPHNAFVDGHCAVIEATLREHQLSADDSFLKKVYPNLRKAMEWFIESFDEDERGVTVGHQWNTYDTAVSGLNTFIGSQYLSALEASARLAEVMGDDFSRTRWTDIKERGMEEQDSLLWNGTYYYQIPGDEPAHDYNNGCHSDQLLGQWWTLMLGGDYLYPSSRVSQACRSIFRHNYKESFDGLPQIPRRYVDDGDGGLYMCTWPDNDRPDPYTLYSIEVWTGIEYSTAGLMVYQGLFDEARTIVSMARSRYDGRPRQNLNSGGGVCGSGNPFDELECGKFYARALSSYGLMVASQGLVVDCPSGLLGFKPKWQPWEHRSFFTLAEGWGLFIQERDRGNHQTERIELRHGTVTLRDMVFEVDEGKTVVDCKVEVNGTEVGADCSQEDEVRIALNDAAELTAGDVVEVTLTME